MKISLSSIRLDGGTQSRVKLDERIVIEYTEALARGDELPAVVVFYDDTHYWLADGFHRYHAHVKAGLDEIPADVREGSQRDAILFSLAANETHGLRRSRADKRKSVETALVDPEWSAWPAREIARRCGVDGKTVAAVRATLNAEFRVERKFVTRHGVEATRAVNRKLEFSEAADSVVDLNAEFRTDDASGLIESVRGAVEAASIDALVGLHGWLKIKIELREVA